MGWKENRRRKRWWYQRYKWVAQDLERTLASASGATLADILQIVHRHTERGRHYGSGFRARSAKASIDLLCQDLGLADRHLTATTVVSAMPVVIDPTCPHWAVVRSPSQHNQVIIRNIGSPAMPNLVGDVCTQDGRVLGHIQSVPPIDRIDYSQEPF